MHDEHNYIFKSNVSFLLILVIKQKIVAWLSQLKGCQVARYNFAPIIVLLLTDLRQLVLMYCMLQQASVCMLQQCVKKGL